MRSLVVGAGVVGQVYGRHLARGGASVTFLVKAKHAEAARRGFALYPLNRPARQRSVPVRLNEYRVLDSIEAATSESWDQVFLTVSSTALRAGDWFSKLARGAGAATVVVLQPGPQDRGFVEQHVKAAQVLQGIITVIGYHAPLPGETRFAEPGVAYWFPPAASSPMDGPTERLRPVLESLRAGGLPAAHRPHAIANASRGAALMMPLLGLLEQRGWSFANLRRKGALALAGHAGREALQAVSANENRPLPRWPMLLFRPSAMRVAMRVAPATTPFDLETYLRVHFTKVVDQTRDLLRTYVAMADQAGLAAPNLRAVLAAMPPLP